MENTRGEHHLKYQDEEPVRTLLEEVYVVFARENPKDFRRCYAVCDSQRTAQAIVDKDQAAGDIQPGALIESHVLQTKELI